MPLLTSMIPDRPKVEGEPHMIGYARVSMSDQKTQRQVDDLVSAGVSVNDIYSDVGTGAHMERPGWELCVKQLEPGDILVIHSLDRLSRDLVHTMTALRQLNERGISIKVLTMDFDSRKPMGRFVFSIMAAFSQFEREIILERTIHGLQKARERGVFGGRELRWTDEQIEAAVLRYGTQKAAAKKLGAAEITIKRRMKAIKEKRGEASMMLAGLLREPEDDPNNEQD